MNKWLAGLAAVILLAVATDRVLVRRDAVTDERLTAAEHNGVTVALAARTSRAAAARAVTRFTASAAPHAATKARADTVHVRDSVALVAAVQPTTPADTTQMIPLQVAQSALSAEHLAAMNERAAAQLRLETAEAAIDSLTGALIAQGAVVANDSVVITGLKAQRPGVFRRAMRGLVDVAGGAVCGGIGLLGGPLTAFAAAGTCIVVIEVARGP